MNTPKTLSVPLSRWNNLCGGQHSALVCFAGVAQTPLYGQAEPTATRSGNLQIGGTFAMANSDYAPTRIRGRASTACLISVSPRTRDRVPSSQRFIPFDEHLRANLRVWAALCPALWPLGTLRRGYVRPWSLQLSFDWWWTPNGKLGANLAYNLGAAGVGVDYRLRRSINLRADYEFQNWLGFPPHGLTPTVLDFGVAYHFH